MRLPHAKFACKHAKHIQKPAYDGYSENILSNDHSTNLVI